MVRTAQPRNRRRILCKGWSVTRKWPEKHRCISGVLSVPYSGSKAMRKLKKDPIREDRINNEAIVDAYGPEERALGWYYYLKNQLRFPFEAKCSAATVVSPLSKGETVQVLRMAPEDVCSDDMLVLIRWHGRTMAVPLSPTGRSQRGPINRQSPRRLALLGSALATVSDLRALAESTRIYADLP